MYAIALIIDDSVKIGDLAKANNVSATLSGFLELVQGEPNYYVLQGTTIPVRNYIALTRNLPKGIRNKIQATDEQDGIVLPQPAMFDFNDGIDYTRDEIVRRIKLWSREDGCTHIWIVDLNTDLTGDIHSKFIPL